MRRLRSLTAPTPMGGGAEGECQDSWHVLILWLKPLDFPSLSAIRALGLTSRAHRGTPQKVPPITHYRSCIVAERG